MAPQIRPVTAFMFCHSSLCYKELIGIKKLEKLNLIVGTDCAPLVADLFLFCYERDFMTSHSDNNQAD